MLITPVTIWLAIQANDGLEVEYTYYRERTDALVNDVEDDDDYGDITVLEVPTYEGSSIHKCAIQCR